MDLNVTHSAKLEPFLLMAKNAKGAAAAKLIQDVTSAPGVFVFSELLDLPNIKALADSPDHSASYQLLSLFAFRTYRHYLNAQGSVPTTLNNAQKTKLRHLTLITLAKRSRIIPYTVLLHELDVPSIRELEDLIIDAIYLDVLRARLDQSAQQLQVEFTIGRDLNPEGELEHILSTLKNWAQMSQSILKTLDEKVLAVNANAKNLVAGREAHEKEVQANLKIIADRQKESKKKMQFNPERENRDTQMEVDEPSIPSPTADSGKTRNRKSARPINTPSSEGPSTRKRNRLGA